MRIIIVDDHPLYLEALEHLLQNDFEIVSKVNDGLKAVVAAREKAPDIILMDINIPGLDGIEATKKIKAEMPEIKIVILTSFKEKEMLFRSIKAGAAGYLLKNLDGKEIISNLKTLSKGINPFSPGMVEFILQEFQENYDEGTNVINKELLSKLNDKQIKVIEHLARGLNYREIGENLYISERTVKYHMENIKNRLNLKTQEQVIAWAWEQGISKV
ncbi:response regulator transcription factor [Natranaerofaba carboxydovora]|uniref:response regulator transcription factor n=1 Tax=Natranaerofaba carboxydovora TaxID=2742683 RepID=UPI001F12F1B7|nr:response regulator transcription factor [Natranaerofaba carboxydovora]UMZ72800.1 Oxygen regulatory protein NreC [Natranaerofaba carboxydovora]